MGSGEGVVVVLLDRLEFLVTMCHCIVVDDGPPPLVVAVVDPFWSGVDEPPDDDE